MEGDNDTRAFFGIFFPSKKKITQSRMSLAAHNNKKIYKSHNAHMPRHWSSRGERRHSPRLGEGTNMDIVVRRPTKHFTYAKKKRERKKS